MTGVRKGKRGYTGLLNERILLPYIRGGWARGVYGPKEQRADERIRRQEYEQKLPLLFSHYGISLPSPDAWKELALALAFEHVPGFKEQRARGRDRVVSIDVLYKLYCAARRKKHTLSKSVKVTNTRVCAALAKDQDFKKAVPELAKCGGHRLENLLSIALEYRRNAVKFRWSERGKARRIAALPPDERESLEGFNGDTPYWPHKSSRKGWW